MKTIKQLSILLITIFLATSCSSESQEASSTTTAEPTTSKKETEKVQTPEEPKEISEADLRDPFKQYQRYRDLSNATWSRRDLSIDETQLRDVADDSFAEGILKIFKEAKEEGYYFQDPEGYEEIEFSELTYASQEFYTEDENGLPEYSEGSTVQFSTCEVDDAIATYIETNEPYPDSEDQIDTTEKKIQMVFTDGNWKINALDLVNETSGVVECDF